MSRASFTAERSSLLLSPSEDGTKLKYIRPVRQTDLPLTSSKRVASAAASAPLATRHPSDHLRALIAEHEKLLTRVAKRRKDLERVADEIRTAVMRVDSHIAPLAQEARKIDTAIHAMLGALETDKKRPKRERNQIRRLHRDLEKMGVLSPQALAPDDEPIFRESDDDGGEFAWADRDGSAQPDVATTKETQHGAIRDLFRRLAEALHPDKVQDEEERATRTEVMKQITVAYRERDYARLIEIERAWATSSAIAATDDDEQIARRHAALVQANDELRKQLRGIDRELREMRRSDAGELARDLKRGARGRSDGLGEIVGTADRELDGLRRVHDFVRAFQGGEIGLKEFLRGPSVEEDAEDMSQVIEDAMGMIVELMNAEAARGRSGRGRGRRK